MKLHAMCVTTPGTTLPVSWRATHHSPATFGRSIGEAPGQIAFVILRTDDSPPVVLHPPHGDNEGQYKGREAGSDHAAARRAHALPSTEVGKVIQGPTLP